MQIENKAKDLFVGPFNCAQSVLGTFSERFDLDIEIAYRIATPFGGGIGHSGLTCGAVSGAIMVIGLARGVSSDDKEQKYACYELAHSFLERFTAQHGSTTCPGLLGYNLGNPNELEEVRELNLFHTRCPDFVGDAVRIVAELLELEA